MTTLYKNTGRIAATITALLVLSVGTAVAVTTDGHKGRKAQETKRADQSAESLGRFVVTPKSVQFIEPAAETIGRFVVSQHRAVFVSGQVQAKA